MSFTMLRGVKNSPAFFFLEVREFFQQVFVGVAHDVGRVVAITEAMLGHVLDEVFEARVGEAVFVRPARVVEAREDAAERGLVRLLDGEHRFCQAVADVLRRIAHVAPMAAVRDGEEVHFGERGIFLVAAGFCERGVVFFIPVVGNALVKKQRRDVGLVLVLIDRPAHDVAGLEQPLIERLAREFRFVCQ